MADIKNNSFLFLLGRFASRRGLSIVNKLFIIVLFSVSIIVSDFLDAPYIAYFKHYLVTFSLPIKTFANKIIEMPEALYKYIALKKENEKLKLELERIKLKSVIDSGLENELLELRKIVNLKRQSDSFDFIERVLGFDGSIYDSFLLISATQTPTKKNSVVISSDCLIGVIYELHGKIAKVLPLTNTKMFIPVKTNSGNHLILKGTGKNELVSVELQNYVTKDFKLDDILYTSGEGGVYKKGIPVAKITKIDSQQVKIFAKPIADFDNLNYVWVTETLA